MIEAKQRLGDRVKGGERERTDRENPNRHTDRQTEEETHRQTKT